MALISLALAGCAASPKPQVAAPAPPPVEAAFPRNAPCAFARKIVEPGISKGMMPGVDCVPPRWNSPVDEARDRAWRGDYAGAGDCMVAAYEAAPSRADLAYDAASLYRRAQLPALARVYYQRLLAQAPNHPRADEARKWLSEPPR